MEAVIYLRVSTQDQGRSGYSLQEQEIACRTKAAETGVTASVCFCDDVSGDLDRGARTGLDDALTYCQERRPAYFICYDPDRLSRGTALALSLADDIERMGVRLAFVLHEYQMTPEGKLFFTLRAAVSEYEKAKILERTGRGKRGARRKGRIPNAVVCYGYDFVTRVELERRQLPLFGRQLEVNEREAWWVREIFRWVREEQIGPKLVADRLNQLSVPTKRGRERWSRSVVHRMLRNSIYTGTLVLNRWNFTGLGKWVNVRRELRPGLGARPALTPRVRRREEWMTVPVPAIISHADFAAVQSTLSSRSCSRGEFLLSGLALCGGCGGTLQYGYNANIRGYYLRCGRRCGARAIRAAGVEDEVWGHACTLLCRLEVLTAYLGRRVALPARDHAERLQRLEERLEALTAERSRWLRLVARGRVTEEEGERELARLHAQMGAVRQAAQEAEAEADADAGAGAGARGPAAGGAEALGARVRGALECMRPEQRRRLVRMLFRAVRKAAGAPASFDLWVGSHDPGEGALQSAGVGRSAHL